jgi:hypothetical protein
MEAFGVMKLFVLKLKAQRYLVPLLCVVVALQLFLGLESSYALAEREPPLSLAVQNADNDMLSNELVDKLKGITGFEIICVDEALQPHEVFKHERVQGLLCIPQDFGDKMQRGKQAPLMLYPAPGISNDEYAKEQIGGAIMQLRAACVLNAGLEELDATAAFEKNFTKADLLEVVYEGPLIEHASNTASVAYGVSALLILLAFLHAALTVPTRDDMRLLVHGTKASLASLVVSLLLVWLTWLVVIAAFFCFLTAGLGIALDMRICLGFVVIMLYVSVVAALLALYLGRHAASWVFLPLFLLSMTIGGGLWGKLALAPICAPLVPVSVVSATETSSMALWVVLAATIVALCALFVCTQARLTKLTR